MEAAYGAFQGIPAAAESGAEDRGRGDLHPIQTYFRQVPGKALQASDRHARRVGRDNYQAHVLPVLGAHRADEVGGGRGVIHVHLGAGDPVPVAAGRRQGLNIGLVPLVISLGDRQGHRAAAGCEVGQQRPLLIGGAGLEDGERAQGGRTQVRPGDGAAPQLFEQHAGVRV